MRNPYQKSISHGVIPTLEKLTLVSEKVAEANNQNDLPFSFAVTANTSRFDYLFPALQT